MGSLENCHEKLREILGNIEPIEVLRNVDEHRRFWRPDKVKTVLLAESHVSTGREEAALTIEFPPNISSSAPKSFVRLVYCLGYGENGLLQNPIKNPPNSGTWQYWQVFHSCVNQVACNEDFAAVQKTRTPDLCQRIRNKLQLLEELKQKGIWLVDGSLAALYSPGRDKLPPKKLALTLQTSWGCYVRDQVVDAKPEQIICIGEGVRQSLVSCFQKDCLHPTPVKQPNARMSTQERFETFKKYFEICSGAR
jgi:hypothetical protein